MFCLNGNAKISHEGTKLSKKCFNKNCSIRTATSYGENYLFLCPTLRNILSLNSFVQMESIDPSYHSL